MGARTNAAATRVAEQRQRLGASIEALDAQVRRDVRGVGSGLAESASTLGERIVQQAQDLPGAESVREQTTRHPLSALLAGFGAGVALGVTGDALMPDPRARQPRRAAGTEASADQQRASNGVLSALTGGMLGTVAGPLGEELRSMLHEAVTGFLGKRPEQQQEQPESDQHAPEVPRAA